MAVRKDRHKTEPEVPNDAPGERVDPMALGLDPAIAGVQGVLQGIPGYDWLSAKAAKFLGVPEQYTAQQQSKLRAENPEVSAVGEMVGKGAAFAGAAGAGGALGAGAKGIAGAVGTSGALEATYEMGQAAHQAQELAHPINVEQISNALDWGQIAIAGGLGAAGPAVSAAGKAASGFLKRMASEEAGKLVTQVAKGLRQKPTELGALVLEKGLEQPGKAAALAKQAGSAMDALVSKLPADITHGTAAAEALQDVIKGVGPNAALQPIVRQLTKQANMFAGKPISGPDLQSVISTLKAQARGAAKTAPQNMALLNNAAYRLEATMTGLLEPVHEGASTAYRAAAAEYRLFSNVAKGVEKAPPQATLGAEAALAAVGLPFKGAAQSAINLVTTATKPKSNYARLLNDLSGLPSKLMTERVGRTVEGLLTGALSEGHHQDMEESWREQSKAVMQVRANPQEFAEKLHEQLSDLPGPVADAIVANKVNKLIRLGDELPKSNAPPSVFGATDSGVTDSQKRTFVKKFHAIMVDPYAGLASSDPSVAKLAQELNPETAEAVKSKLVAHIAEGKPVPFRARQRLKNLLGNTTGLQDPLVGGTLQNITRNAKMREQTEQQLGSARTSKAMKKADQAAMSRSQQILRNDSQK